jgi:hypothetical protein
MIEAEGEIESGIAEPSALGVYEDRAIRPDEDVLRTDIAVDDRQLGARGLLRQLFQSGRTIGMRSRRRQQVGLEAQGIKYRIGREFCRSRR